MSTVNIPENTFQVNFKNQNMTKTLIVKQIFVLCVFKKNWETGSRYPLSHVTAAFCWCLGQTLDNKSSRLQGANNSARGVQ